MKLISIILIVVGLVIFGTYTVSFSNRDSDFVQDYIAATKLLQGTSVYGDSTPSFLPDLLKKTETKNFHPPLSAVFFIPFSYLPYWVAFVTWNILLLASLAGIFILIRSEYPATNIFYSTALGITLLTYPFIESVGLDQSSPLLALLLTLTWVFLRRKKEAIAGIILGSAIALKMFPALAIVGLIFSRSNRTVISSIIAVLFLSAAFCLIGDSADIMLFFTDIAPRNSNLWSYFVSNYSLRGVIVPLFSVTPWSLPVWSAPEIGTTCSTIFSLVFLIYYAYLAKKVSLIGGAPAAFLISLPAMLILSPIAWPHYLLILLPCLLILILNGQLANRFHIILIVALFSLPQEPLIGFIQREIGLSQLPYVYLILAKLPLLGVAALMVLLTVERSSDVAGRGSGYSVESTT